MNIILNKLESTNIRYIVDVFVVEIAMNNMRFSISSFFYKVLFFKKYINIIILIPKKS